MVNHNNFWWLFAAAFLLVLLARMKPFSRLLQAYEKWQRRRALQRIVFTKQAFRRDPIETRGYLAFATVIDPHTLIVTRVPDDCPVQAAEAFAVPPKRFGDADAERLALFVAALPDVWAMRFLKVSGGIINIALPRGSAKDAREIVKDIDQCFRRERRAIEKAAKAN